jgi:hypothetical protein
MSINIRVKGASAEREIATILNNIVLKVLNEFNISESISSNHNLFAQRNQNQTAVGGNDLINTYGFGIEVKRQEALSINTWWRQCASAAFKNNEVPVLLFKQSRKKWRCIMQGFIGLPSNQFGSCRMEIDFDTFLAAYERHVRFQLGN